MDFKEQRIGNALLLKPSGRIDHASADAFKSALLPYLEQCKGGGDVVVLDFSAIEYISSIGFQVLLVAQRKAKKQLGALAIASLQPAVQSTFEMANFAGAIRCFASVRDALAEMSWSALNAYTQKE